MADDKEWATKYLLAPLNAPAPSDETGPGSQSISAVAGQKERPMGPGSKKTASTMREPPSYTSRSAAYPTPPSSTVPSREPVSRLSPTNRNKPSDLEPQSRQRSRFGDQSPFEDPSIKQPGRRRASSLTSRFPGDRTHHPLDMLKRETKIAYRAPHLRKQHMPGPDLIDNLDNAGTTYHHEGPYDAALLARNLTPQISPLEAVKWTNEKALRATPKENIRDSLESHRPLDGVAIIPPGMKDLSGHTMEYEEGTDMMIENGGDYKRWPGVEYHPDDLKGKGEPSYSIELALKQHKRKDNRRVLSDGGSGYEMTARLSSSGGRDGGNTTGPQVRYRDWQGDTRRRHTTGRSVGQGLKNKIGSSQKEDGS